MAAPTFKDLTIGIVIVKADLGPLPVSVSQGYQRHKHLKLHDSIPALDFPSLLWAGTKLN